LWITRDQAEMHQTLRSVISEEALRIANVEDTIPRIEDQIHQQQPAIRQIFIEADSLKYRQSSPTPGRLHFQPVEFVHFMRSVRHWFSKLRRTSPRYKGHTAEKSHQQERANPESAVFHSYLQRCIRKERGKGANRHKPGISRPSTGR
jgi:hypothetical protein